MKINSKLTLRTIGGESVLLYEGVGGVDFGKLITLNSSALYLWERLQPVDEFDEHTVASLLLQRYDVSQEVAKNDAVLLCEVWKKADIVE